MTPSRSWPGLRCTLFSPIGCMPDGSESNRSEGHATGSSWLAEFVAAEQSNAELVRVAVSSVFYSPGRLSGASLEGRRASYRALHAAWIERATRAVTLLLQLES